MILNRWRTYFEEVSTIEFAHPSIPSSFSVHGPVQKITVAEVEAALKKISRERQRAPMVWRPAYGSRNPDSQRSGWRRSSIRLLRRRKCPIFGREARRSIKLSDNQCGFVTGCGNIDAIHAARLLVEKHREKQKPVHLAFLDLEKAFDRVPREVIWYALREHGVSEELVEWVRILYSCSKSRVQAAAGTSMEFSIFVGVHQGSALSPLLFVWTLLYAGDVMLASKDKVELQRQVQAWCDRFEGYGLRLNVKKTEYMTTDEDESSYIKVNGIELPRTSVFRCLGSAIASDGGLLVEANSRSEVQMALSDGSAVRQEDTRVPKVEDLQSSRPTCSYLWS
ncbi:unnamed protein product [Heligmosomoides polygyrus]|uniref:Reverse transcriptase domain-containing protein n=1 Tax=Heligmosomoides polygyrus TaxID=6339 RepID=A0A183G9C2_HELPZ|nr:unnamed protein product [Heligmosomoides polygyrus]